MTIRTEEGIQALITGGDRPHIGAVTVMDRERKETTLEFPDHRDSHISRRWAAAFAEKGWLPAVVSAGVHYDRLSREGIIQVLKETEGLLRITLERMKNDERI